MGGKLKGVTLVPFLNTALTRLFKLSLEIWRGTKRVGSDQNRRGRRRDGVRARGQKDKRKGRVRGEKKREERWEEGPTSQQRLKGGFPGAD